MPKSSPTTRSGASSTPRPASGVKKRVVVITAGRAKIRAELLDTPTAERVWRALPIHSSIHTWGQAVHFETPVESGRENNAQETAKLGDICFWTEDDRVVIAYGRTPISRPNEIRLPRPCNVWARALDDVRVLNGVRPGEKVSLTAAKD